MRHAAPARLTLLATLVLILALAAPLAAATRPFTPVQAGPTSVADDVELWAPDRVLVQFTPEAMVRSGLTLAQDKGAQVLDARTGLPGVDAVLADAGVRSLERPYRIPRNLARARAVGADRWFAVRVDGGDMQDLARRLAAETDVDQATVDWRAFPAVVPSDPYFADHWGHDNTAQLPDLDWGGTYDHTLSSTVGTVGFDANAPAAWDASQGFGDPSVVIAILDSGVDVDHPDLRLISGYDFGDNDTNPDDNSSQPGHGTCCAGVAAAVNNGLGAVGIAAGCSIMPCKVADSGGSMYFSYIQDALYWAADNGADVISMSLGAAISSDPATDAALQYAYDAGVVILAATGNENDNAISYPAVHQAVIGVGAASPCGERKRSSSSSLEVNPGVSTDPNGYTCDGERWWGSNYGSTVPDAAGAVDILAPTILPTTDIGGNGGYRSGDYEPFFNGTSCATPYAAGVAGLVLSANPGFTPAQVREALVSTAQDVVSVESGAGWDRYSGYGMIDAAAAVGGGGPVAPTAAFSASPLSGSYPLEVAFSDQSGGAPTSWSWDFGDGAVSTAQSPLHTYTAAGVYTVSLTVSNAVGSDSVTEVDYVTVTEPGQTTFVTASDETPVDGAVSGDFTFTAAADGLLETITEVAYTGHPRKTYSFLEHHWNFDLPAGGAATFHLEASRTDNADGDDFRFEYSTDGATWLLLATVSSSAPQAFSVELGVLSGAVTVRVIDTDRNWNNSSMDTVAVDRLVFELGDVQPTPPTAQFAGTPTAGEVPLAVQFNDLSTGDPTSWSWDFGDGGVSSVQNPAHTYNAAGIYTVTLTATNSLGSDAETKVDYITVTEPGQGPTSLHVDAMSIARGRSGPNTLAECTVTVVDDQGQPVSDATVTCSYDGPTNGTVSGVTGGDGNVVLVSAGFKKPSGEWCFEVTGLAHASLTYAPGDNVVTRVCEGGVAFGADTDFASGPALFGSPNPFNPRTELSFRVPAAGDVRLAVYDVRGRIVETLVDQRVGPGTHTVTWDARGAAGGVYFARLEGAGFVETVKLILLK